MEYTIGFALALATVGMAIGTGLGRERSFYATVMIVIASCYVLFAVMGGSSHAIVLESLIAVGFSIVAIIGFRMNLWLVVAAMVGHGLFDVVHHRFIENPGVPQWWSGFCLAFDIAAGVFLAFLLVTRRNFSVQAHRS
ncbi:MAG: hypothetical protein ACKVQU_36895 [Burkholderiales bacterium]